LFNNFSNFVSVSFNCQVDDTGLPVLEDDVFKLLTVPFSLSKDFERVGEDSNFI
jgi:hypothetical protein